jgi:glycosyltransferase involved in cell wall biosynthesis
MPQLSFVIPALNEQENIVAVLGLIPTAQLRAAGLVHEVIVVDNGSTDNTADLALQCGARVVHQSRRGYGNAYRAGFDAALGDVIITGDADCTYPFDHAVGLVNHLEQGGFDFLSTDRLRPTNRHAMKRTHAWANWLLSALGTSLFRAPFRDSQSGMWVFRRHVWPRLDVRSPGMAFSQEIKHEAHARGFRCAEVPIEYRERGGEVKLDAWRDGVRNLAQMMAHRLRVGGARRPALQAAGIELSSAVRSGDVDAA